MRPSTPNNLRVALNGQVARATGVAVAITACYVLQGIFLSLTLAALFNGAPPRTAVPWVSAFGAVVLVRGALVWWAEIVAQDIGQRTKADLRQRLLGRMADLGPGVVLRRETGELQAAIVAGVEALEGYYSRYLPALWAAIIGCAGVLLCLAWVDWQTALLLAVFVVAFPIADHFWMRWRMPSASGVFAAMGAFGAYLLDSLQGIVTLKAFDAATRRRGVLAKRAADLRHASMATLGATLARIGLSGLISLGGIAVVLSVNTWRTASGELAPFALFVSLFLAREAFRPLDRLEREFHTAWAASGARSPIHALLNATPEVREPTHAQALPLSSDITFDAVTFAYEGKTAPALSSVSFTVRENEFVALVGPSGAGKSTVGALLLRFFDPASGVIRIGGTDVRNLSLELLRSMVSVVSQDTYLFHGSIEDNLRLARPNATSDEVRAAACAAHIDAFIDGLPQGYATAVGERGAQLSGGQRQRLALARALLKQAPILLLDEATSNVDAASERAIQEALDTLASGRTTLVIAHRLSTIRRADRILVMDGGRIVEQGRHRDLIDSGGLYARLALTQGEPA